MMLGVQLFKALPGNVRVDLRGREITVTQQHLDYAQISAAIQQMRRKSVAQAVR